MNTSKAFEALSNITNLELLSLLKEHEEYSPTPATGGIREFGVCLSFIQRKIGLSKLTLSQYLLTLCKAGLVNVEYLGQCAYYKRNKKNILALAEFITSNQNSVNLG